MNAAWLIAPPTPSERFAWHCPTCGKTGWSGSRHGALQRLHCHWRRCAEPGRPIQEHTP